MTTIFQIIQNSKDKVLMQDVISQCVGSNCLYILDNPITDDLVKLFRKIYADNPKPKVLN